MRNQLAGNIANSIEMQRVRLEDQAKVLTVHPIPIDHLPSYSRIWITVYIHKEWDKARAIHSGNLDAILESLERQVVPPDFHLSSSSSSLFGNQGSDNAEDSLVRGNDNTPNGKMRNGGVDRSKWKTLRDFVDFRSIVMATEEMDEDRDMLDVRIEAFFGST